MKKVLYNFGFFLILFTLSCSNNTPSDDSSINQNEDIYEEIIESESDESPSNDILINAESISKQSCDDFIKNYEEFSERYLKVYKRYVNNPTDGALNKDYYELAQVYSEWLQSVPAVVIKCAEDQNFQTKMEAISKRIKAESEKLEKK